MAGGLGNDSYFVDNAGDVVAESPARAPTGASPSELRARRGVSIETCRPPTVGTAAIALAGNELANTVYGNFGNNMLCRRRRQRHARTG